MRFTCNFPLITTVTTILSITPAHFHASARNRNLPDEDKIVHGLPATVGEFPFAASLQTKMDSAHYCGGSLASRRYILTACHCVAKFVDDDNEELFNADEKQVAVGSISNLVGRRSFTGQIRDVASFIAHPDCKTGMGSKGWRFDYGFAKVVRSFVLNDQVQPIQFISPTYQGVKDETEKRTVNNDWCQVIGWGFTEVTAAGKYSHLPSNLQKLDVKLIPSEDCHQRLCNFSKEYCSFLPRHTGQLCAINFAHGDSCHGDSGGPLVCSEYMYGVLSWGPACGEKTLPSMYSSIYGGWQFIQSTLLIDMNGARTLYHTPSLIATLFHQLIHVFNVCIVSILSVGP